MEYKIFKGKKLEVGLTVNEYAKLYMREYNSILTECPNCKKPYAKYYLKRHMKKNKCKKFISNNINEESF